MFSENPSGKNPEHHGRLLPLAALLALREEARHLPIAPRGRVLATRSGGHLSRFRGRGMEFDESRAYQAGDDVRHMDWRVTARAGKPHVKLFREERERPVWLLTDLGPSMRFGTRVAFKSVIAARASGLLAWAAADRGDRVGGLVFDENRHFEQRPAARIRGLLPLLQALAQPPRLGTGGHGLADVVEAAEKLRPLVRPGSLVFLLSDFFGLNPERTAWLAQLGRANELVLVHIHDPLEQSAPPPGLYPVATAAGRGLLDTRSAARREAWEQRFAAHRRQLEELALRHRVHFLSLRTDHPVGPALARGLRPRPAVGRGA